MNQQQPENQQPETSHSTEHQLQNSLENLTLEEENPLYTVGQIILVEWNEYPFIPGIVHSIEDPYICVFFPGLKPTNQKQLYHKDPVIPYRKQIQPDNVQLIKICKNTAIRKRHLGMIKRYEKAL